MTLTYRGHSLVTKALFVQDMADHAAADRLVSGTYGAGSGADWQGCAVGCGIHTVNRVTGGAIRYGDHAALADALGWPEWLCHLDDAIFEGLPTDRGKAWPERLARAVPDGADIGRVRDRWLARMLRVVVLPVAGQNAEIVERVATGLETEWAHDSARVAAGAARRAAGAAYAVYAARRAMYVVGADATDAAYAAAYAVYAARRAMYAAGAAGAAGGAAGAAYVTMADLLIAELQAIPDGAAA